MLESSPCCPHTSVRHALVTVCVCTAAGTKARVWAVQKQIEGSKRKAAAHAADLQSARAEIAELKHAAAQSQREARQAAASGPHVRKLEAETAALRERLREAQTARGAEAEARQQADRAAGQLEETAEEAGVQLRRVQVRPGCLNRCCCGDFNARVCEILWMCRIPSNCVQHHAAEAMRTSCPVNAMYLTASNRI